MIILTLCPWSIRTASALCPTVLLGLAVLLGGCNGYSGDEARPLAAEPDRAKLAQFADRYGSASNRKSAGYKIGPQDVLEVTVFKVPELSKSVQVTESGMVNLPLVGEVPVSGMTANGLERDLEGRLGVKYVKSPQVSVFVKEYNSQRVTIEGAVKKPGVYPVRGNDSLMQTIARAEGLDREISSTNVAIFRDGGRQMLHYDVAQIRSGAVADPEVQMGDVIVVEDSSTKAAFQYLKALTPVASPLVLLGTAL